MFAIELLAAYVSFAVLLGVIIGKCLRAGSDRTHADASI